MIPGSANSLLLASAAGAAQYQIERSLRFNSADSAYLSRTPSSAGNRKTWTWSGWVKRGALGTRQNLFGASTASPNNQTFIYLDSDNTIFIANVDAASVLSSLKTSAVYRDVSAWMHIVVACDTTAVTGSNRIKLYINGSQVSTFSTATYPVQDYNTHVNSTIVHSIGLNSPFGVYPFSGYLADVHLVDGQALTPSSFGYTDSNGIWQPKAYTGSYDNLLKISSSAYSISGTPFGSAYEWNDLLAGTLSYAVIAAIGATYTITFSPALTVSSEVKITKWSAQGISASEYLLNGSVTRTTANFTNHIDTISSATLGGSLGSITLETVAGNDASTVVELTVDGKPVRLNTVNGNGFHLDFADNSAATTAGIGKDVSGNGNHWTPNNLSVAAGSGNDSLVDTPTNYGTDTGAGGEVRGNYCTLNPLDQGSNQSLSNGNLDLTATSTAYASVRGTIGVSSGKWYWEQTITTLNTSDAPVGIGTASASLSTFVGGSAGSYGFSDNNLKWTNNSSSSYTTGWVQGDVLGVAFDADNWTLTLYRNGSSLGTAFTGITPNTYFPMASAAATSSVSVLNFGQRPFAYTAPSGYKALCTTNLPVPAIADGSTAMDVVLDTGANILTAAQGAIGGSADLLWIKDRANANNHQLIDTVRGGTATLQSNTTAAETTYSAPSGSSVAWAWDAGSSTVSNTDGSITSSVRANASAGFSIVTYTGNGVAGATVGHGLGVSPSFIIVKTRNTTGNGWRVYHTALGNTQYIQLDSTDKAYAYTDWNNTTPSSSVITLGASSPAPTNTNGNTYVAYCFAPVAGYSSFGSYTGNGSADGPFVYTSLRTAFVLIKATGAVGGNWMIYDNKRGAFNLNSKKLAANASFEENENANLGSDSFGIDFLSNGFKIRQVGANHNNNGTTYIYAAFAEHPFQTARAR